MSRITRLWVHWLRWTTVYLVAQERKLRLRRTAGNRGVQLPNNHFHYRSRVWFADTFQLWNPLSDPLYSNDSPTCVRNPIDHGCAQGKLLSIPFQSATHAIIHPWRNPTHAQNPDLCTGPSHELRLLIIRAIRKCNDR